MRTYLLTEKERKTLETFLDQGLKLDGFSVLIFRLKKSKKGLTEDYNLIEKTLEKLEKTH